MSKESQPSFSASRRWTIGLNVVLVIMAALVVVIVLNYLSRDYFMRFQLSTNTKIKLAPRTVSLLNSITNQVKITLYYDKKESLYSTVAELLNQYSLINPKVAVETVDYLRDPMAAQKVKAEHPLISATEKNVVLFDCEGKTFGVDGDALMKYITEQVPNSTNLEFRVKPTQFEGETRFSAALLAVTTPKPLNTCFLQGHSEHSLESSDDYGYQKFGAMLQQQNAAQVHSFSLLGTNTLSAEECNLVVIAGPQTQISDEELAKIDNYLGQGGRMLVLFNAASIDKTTGADKTGLDKLLLKWGVQVGTNQVQDPDLFVTSRHDMRVMRFNQKHPLVNPLLGRSSSLHLYKPRSIGRAPSGTQTADAPRVEELAFTGPRAMAGPNSRSQVYPLMAAVEKGAVPGVITERGATRIVVVGDSTFLGNRLIASARNSEFADYAINWLLNRAQLLEGINPRPVNEYRLVISHAQLQRAEWMLLAVLPGGVLMLGGLVWMRRRK